MGLLKKQVTAASYYPVGTTPLPEVVREATRGSFDLVALSVDRSLVVTRNMELPFKDPAQLRKVVPFEAESQLPFRLDEGYVDHYVVDGTRPAGTQVLVFALSHKDFQRLQAVYEATGRTDAFHQVDSYALLNALLALEAIPGGTTALVDVGHSKVCIEILRDGRLTFSRSLQGGGAQLTSVLAEDRGLSLHEAEELKVKVLSSPPEAHPQERAVLDPVIGKLAADIRFTFLSYQGSGAEPVGRVVLSGGTSRATGLAAELAGKLGIEVALPSPKPGILPDLVQQNLARFGPAYGMALFGRDCVSLLGPARGEVTADFLKEGRSFWKYHRKKISTAVTTVLVLALAFVLYQFGQIRRLQAESARLDAHIQGDLAALNDKAASRGRPKLTVTDLDAASREATRRKRLLERGTINHVRVLNEISSQVPAGSNLTVKRFSVESGLVTLDAEIPTNDEADRVIEGLRRSALFEDVRKVESRTAPSKVEFTVQFKVKS